MTPVERMTKKSVLMIFIFCSMATISSAAVINTNIWGVVGVTSINDPLCTTALPKIYSTTYVLANSALYEFLNTRSQLVKTASDRMVYYQYLRTFTNLLAKAIPFLSILTIIFWACKIVIENGNTYCIDNLRWEISLLFACLSIPTAILFLILFVWPLWYHYSKMKSTQGSAVVAVDSDAILRVVKKNTLLSVIAMSSTMIAMTVVTYLSIASSNQAFYNIGIVIANTDLLINMICMCLMTDQWLPKRLKLAVAAHSSKSSSGDAITLPYSRGVMVSPYSENETNHVQTSSMCDISNAKNATTPEVRNNTLNNPKILPDVPLSSDMS